MARPIKLKLPITPAPAPVLSRASFARWLSVDKARISQWLHEGVLTPPAVTAAGIDPRLAVAQLKAARKFSNSTSSQICDEVDRDGAEPLATSPSTEGEVDVRNDPAATSPSIEDEVNVLQLVSIGTDLVPSPPIGGDGAPPMTFDEALRQHAVSVARKRAAQFADLRRQWLPVPFARIGWAISRERLQEGLLRLPAEIVAAVGDEQNLAVMSGLVQDTVYQRMEELSEGGGEETAAEVQRRAVAAGLQDDPLLPEVPDTASKIEADTARVVALTRKHDLELSITRGEQINVTEWVRAQQGVLLSLRAALLAMPARLPPLLIGGSTADRLATIRGLISEALERLPEQLTLPGRTAPLPASADNDDDPPEAEAPVKPPRKHRRAA